MTTQKKLARLFQLTGDQEIQLEVTRQNLGKVTSFEPYASFQRLDRLSKGYLTPRDIINFLKDNGIEYGDEQDCKLVIRYFDSTGEGRLFYTDYLQILLPCDNSVLRATCTQRPTYPVGPSEYLPFDVERLLAKLVQKELKLAREAEKIKEELASRYDFNIERLFKDVDDINYNYVDAQNLKRFLIKCGIFPNQQMIIAILRRFDLDADAKLNKKEFIEGVQVQQQEFSKRQIKETASLAKSSRVLSPSRNQRSTLRSSSRTADRSMTKSFKSPYGKSSTKKKGSAMRTLKSAAKQRPTEQNDYSTIQNSVSRRQDEERDLQEPRSILKSPSRQDLSPERKTDNSPLRLKYLSSSSAQFMPQQSVVNDGNLYKSITSPSQSYLKNDSLSKSKLDMSQLSIKSPTRKGREEANDIDGSLIYLTRNCFKEILAIESGLEQSKKELAVRSDFTLAGAFNFFTGYSQSRITAEEMLYGLERLGVTCEISDVRLLVERYDADRDQRLGFWEFSNALLPADTLIRDDLERRKAQFELGHESKDLLRRVYRRIIDAECMIEHLRQKIAREGSVNLRKAFDALDWLGRGFLTSNEFRRQFDQINQRVSNASIHQSIVFKNDSIELECMIRRFNKDKLNGRISLPEFLEELTPKNPEKNY